MYNKSGRIRDLLLKDRAPLTYDQLLEGIDHGTEHDISNAKYALQRQGYTISDTTVGDERILQVVAGNPTPIQRKRRARRHATPQPTQQSKSAQPAQARVRHASSVQLPTIAAEVVVARIQMTERNEILVDLRDPQTDEIYTLQLVD